MNPNYHGTKGDNNQMPFRGRALRWFTKNRYVIGKQLQMGKGKS